MNNRTATKEFLSNSATIISLAYAATLVLVVVHDFVMLSSLHLQFAKSPTTISDHLKSGLDWLPATILTILLLIAYDRINSQLVSSSSKFSTRPELLKNADYSFLVKKFLKIPTFIWLTLILILLESAYQIFGDVVFFSHILAITLPLIALIVVLMDLINSKFEDVADDIKLLIRSFAVLLVVAVLVAESKARAIKSEEMQSTCVVDYTEAFDCSLILSGANGVLVISSDKETMMIPWNSLVAIKNKQRLEEFKGLTGSP